MRWAAAGTGCRVVVGRHGAPEDHGCSRCTPQGPGLTAAPLLAPAGELALAVKLMLGKGGVGTVELALARSRPSRRGDAAGYRIRTGAAAML